MQGMIPSYIFPDLKPRAAKAEEQVDVIAARSGARYVPGGIAKLPLPNGSSGDLLPLKSLPRLTVDIEVTGASGTQFSIVPERLPGKYNFASKGGKVIYETPNANILAPALRTMQHPVEAFDEGQLQLMG